MREAITSITDPDRREDINGFIRKEAHHQANHRRYNEKLKANGYPELATVETTFEADYTALERASLEWRLAYCAGFETMTMGITQWLIDERDQLFNGADPTVTSLVLRHMVEATEHKPVAYDGLRAVSGRYWLRVAGLLHGSLHVGLMSRRAYMVMLKKRTDSGEISVAVFASRRWLRVFSRKPDGRCCKRFGPAIIRTRSTIPPGSLIGDPPMRGMLRILCRYSIRSGRQYFPSSNNRVSIRSGRPTSNFPRSL